MYAIPWAYQPFLSPVALALPGRQVAQVPQQVPKLPARTPQTLSQVLSRLELLVVRQPVSVSA